MTVSNGDPFFLEKKYNRSSLLKKIIFLKISLIIYSSIVDNDSAT